MKFAIIIVRELGILVILELMRLRREGCVRVVRLGAPGVLMEIIIILAIRAPLAITW